MLIIEYDLEQCTDNVVLRYKESGSANNWKYIEVDAKTLALLIKGWGVACIHPDNGATRNAPILCRGVPLHMPCGDREHNCIDEVIATTAPHR